jgi:hypothetical protein
MLRSLFLSCLLFISAQSMAASSVYVQHGPDGSVTFGDAASMPPKATLKIFKPANSYVAPKQAPAPMQHSEAMDTLNQMEQRNLKDMAESRARKSKLFNQAAQEKNKVVHAQLLSQIEVETQSTEIYAANLNQIKKSKETISKEQSL